MYSTRHKQGSPEYSGDYHYLTVYNRALNYINFCYLPYILLQGMLIQEEEKPIHLVTEAISLMTGNSLLYDSLELLAKPAES